MIGARRKPSPIEAEPGPAEAPAPRTAAVVAGDLTVARDALAAREADVRDAASGYEAALDVSRDAALAARDRLTGAEVDRDIARRAVSRLDAEHAAAVDGERRAGVAHVVAEADAAVAAYRGALEDRLPELGRVARGLVRLWAEAELANAAAEEALRNDLKAKGINDPPRCRPPVEAFRNWPGRQRELLEPPVERTLWTNAGGIAVGDEFQGRIVGQPDGSGVLQDRSVRTVFKHRRTFTTETFLPDQDGTVADPLVKMLNVPGVTALDRAGWEPVGYADAGLVLARLDELERPTPPAEDRRLPITKERPVGPPVEVWRPPANERITQVLSSR